MHATGMCHPALSLYYLTIHFSHFSKDIATVLQTMETKLADRENIRGGGQELTNKELLKYLPGTVKKKSQPIVPFSLCEAGNQGKKKEIPQRHSHFSTP